MIANWIRDYYQAKGTEHFDEAINNIVDDVNNISAFQNNNELNMLRYNLHHVDNFLETTFFTYGIDYLLHNLKFSIPRIKINIFNNLFTRMKVAE